VEMQLDRRLPAVLGAAVLGTLAATITALLARRRKHDRRRANSGTRFGVSARGLRLNTPTARIGGVIDFKDPFLEESVRSLDCGDWVFMALAENKLMHDVLQPRVVQALQQTPESSMSYVSMQGQVALRQTLSTFLERHVMKVPVQPNELVCMTGVSAILSNLFYCICDDGDSVLIPAPYYSAFDSDLRAYCNLERVLVPLDAEAGYRLSVTALEAAYSNVQQTSGRKPKAVLLTNPHNPLGRIAPREELEEILGWCTTKGMHLVSDEIYALSSFCDRSWPSSPATAVGTERQPVGGRSFVSVGEVCAGKLNEHVHIMWSVSKDFGMAGVRMGVLWSKNSVLLEALRGASKFTSVSGVTQHLVTDLLADRKFVESYIAENRKRLRESCDFLLHQLDQLGIEYVQPAAGIFVWVDLWPLLGWLAVTRGGGAPENFEGELHHRLMSELFIVLTPGSPQHAARPGWFRICYAAVSLCALRKAMARFSAWVGDLRRSAEHAEAL